MTPLGHLSVGYIIGQTNKRIIISYVCLGSILPDIDFILIGFRWFNEVHRKWTHNLLFAIVISIGLCIFQKKNNKYLVAFSLLSGILLHIFIDSIMDNNPSNGIGVALFWPFSQVFFSPFNLFAEKSLSFTWQTPSIFIYNAIFLVMLVEVPFWFLAGYIFYRKRTFV
jgi:membrane-bound metal-dependent hydrolase YbcI (DUF457 family)